MLLKLIKGVVDMGCVPFGISELKVLDVLESTDGKSLKYVVEGRNKPFSCCVCGASGHLNVHGGKKRLIQDFKLANKLVYLELFERRYICSDCGHTFVEPFESIDNILRHGSFKNCIAPLHCHSCGNSRECFCSIFLPIFSSLVEPVPRDFRAFPFRYNIGWN